MNSLLMKSNILWAASLCIAVVANGQHEEAYQKVISETNTAALYELQVNFEQEEKEAASRVEAYIQRTGEPRSTTDDLGNFVEIVDIENGHPIYRVTHSNVNAAKTIGTQHLHTWSPVGLLGNGLTVGVWDGGAVRTSHVEFKNLAGTAATRAVRRDGTTSLSSHATHVAGTIGAVGVRSDAKGMAPEVNLDTYYWNSDASEMTAAAANGLLISNHSYGQRRGWYGNTWYGDANISTSEDYRFGFYESRASAWDAIAFNAPYYLICKSAGNDRNDQGDGSKDPDGPWDCIGDGGIAKNVLTVGAVMDISNGYTQASDVVLTSFSSTGPADDGRVKPDVVANGYTLLSSEEQSDTDYGTKSGTSMSSPSAAGSLILLQELHSNIHGAFMRSATLKGLVIHTADEAGTTPGPDYEYGWGLLNMERAANFIEDATLTNPTVYILEEKITNGDEFKFRFYADGSSPVKATVCWTDPASNALTPSLNPRTAVLINDLDVRIRKVGASNVYMPYKLNPNFPTAGATKGDNLVDNVELVDAGVLPAGNYELVVSHKATLQNGEQNFSLILNDVTELPTANVAVTKVDVCVGDSSELTNVSKSATSVSWYLDNQSTPFDTANTIHLGSNKNDTFLVKLRISNSVGVDTTTVQVRFYESPSADFAVDSIMCLPDHSMKSATATIPGGTWFSPDPYRGGQWLNSMDSVSFSPSSVGLGTYPLIYEVSNAIGCTSRDTVNIRFIKGTEVEFQAYEVLCHYDAPIALIGGSPAGGSYAFNGSAITNFDPSQYREGWNFITYQYTDSMGCVGEAQGTYIVEQCEDRVGIEESNGNVISSVYPNPVLSGASLSWNSEQSIRSVVLYATDGRVITSEVYSTSVNQLIIPEGTPTGLYHVVLTNTEGLSTTVRLMVQE